MNYGLRLQELPDWEADHFSEIRFEFAQTKDGTEMKFEQKGLPLEEFEGIKKGWIQYYWEPMKAFFSRS